MLAAPSQGGALQTGKQAVQTFSLPTCCLDRKRAFTASSLNRDKATPRLKALPPIQGYLGGALSLRVVATTTMLRVAEREEKSVPLNAPFSRLAAAFFITFLLLSVTTLRGRRPKILPVCCNIGEGVTFEKTQTSY